VQREATIVLVGGLPGSGKTYFSKRLAERINANYLSSDSMRKSLRARGKYDIKDKLLIYLELVKVAESKVLNEHLPVIVDATFSHRAMRQPFMQLASKKSLPLKFIWVFADEQLIRKRTGKDREESEADYNVYLKIRDELEPLDIPHLAVESTDENIEAMLRKGVTYIFSDAGK
jgi:predicted kinase